MGYLVCKKCRGYYKLQPNESPTNFTNTCACGGELRYAVNIDIVENNKKVITKENKKYHQNQTSFTNYKSTRYKHEFKQSNLINCPDCDHKLVKKLNRAPIVDIN